MQECRSVRDDTLFCFRKAKEPMVSIGNSLRTTRWEQAFLVAAIALFSPWAKSQAPESAATGRSVRCVVWHERLSCGRHIP
jgi:hypothetical protein